MVYLASGLPLLQVGRHEIVNYSAQWIEESIKEAAHRAGHEKWWFARDVSRGVIAYLRERFQSTVITLSELFEKIRRTLESLGFADIASQLTETPPPWRIPLHEIADEAGDGYELTFFHLLNERLNEALRLGAMQVHLTGSRPAAQQLHGTQRWTTSCERVHKEILQFIQARLRNHTRMAAYIF